MMTLLAQSGVDARQTGWFRPAPSLAILAAATLRPRHIVRTIRSACKSTAEREDISRAAIPRWRSALCQHRGARPSASSIHILCQRNRLIGGIAAHTKCLAALCPTSSPDRYGSISSHDALSFGAIAASVWGLACRGSASAEFRPAVYAAAA